MKAWLASAALAGAVVLATAAPAFAQCVDLCAVSCVKPISIPDRWDDATGIAGYMGGMVGAKRMPDWRNNRQYDSEGFIDANANSLWDPGETFTDGNGNGLYDREAYDPLTTGYTASRDLGLELLLGTPGSLALAFPPVNRGTPIVNDSESYSDNWHSCAPTVVGAGDVCLAQYGTMVGPTNTAMRDLIAQDPDASWDPVTATVQGSTYPRSPRVIFFLVADPRLRTDDGRISITKVVAFFMEQMDGNAEVRGRFLRAMGTGEACAGAGAGFVMECTTPARPTSWGRVKDLYR